MRFADALYVYLYIQIKCADVLRARKLLLYAPVNVFIMSRVRYRYNIKRAGY